MAKIKGKEHLAFVVSKSRSITDLAKQLGYATAKGNKMCGGVYKFLKQKIEMWDIDTSHFVGKGWAKGHTRHTDIGIEKQAKLHEKSDSEIFCEHSRVGNRTVVTRLLKLGLPYCCNICKIDQWQGRPLRLQLDHVNGINNDNRRKNLRLLCPNCHSQTDTYSIGAARVWRKGRRTTLR